MCSAAEPDQQVLQPLEVTLPALQYQIRSTESHRAKTEPKERDHAHTALPRRRHPRRQPDRPR